MIEPAQYLIVIESSRSQLVTTLFVALGCNTRAAMRTRGAELERRFATFAGVPYHDPVSRLQWEQVWSAEP
jgi:hypothetical protein